MSDPDTEQFLTTILGALRGSYGTSAARPDDDGARLAWASLARLPRNAVVDAVKAWVAAEPWPPTPADIAAAVRKSRPRPAPDGEEAAQRRERALANAEATGVAPHPDDVALDRSERQGWMRVLRDRLADKITAEEALGAYPRPGHAEITRCPGCSDGSGWVETESAGRGTVRPCEACEPGTYRLWRDGHFRAGHVGCDECSPRRARARR